MADSIHIRLASHAGVCRLSAPGDVVGVVGEIDDYSSRLSAAEFPVNPRAVQRRRDEVSTGRYYARLAQEFAGLSPVPIGRGEDRAPIWPHNLVGSISHNRSHAVVVICDTQALVGLGVDIEDPQRVPEKVHRMIARPRELECCTEVFGRTQDALAFLFSAKEAVYKAIYPVARNYIGFMEVEITIDAPNRTFTANYLGGVIANTRLNRGVGRYIEFESQLITLFQLYPDDPF